MAGGSYIYQFPGVIFFIGFMFYIYSIKKSGVIPEKITWLIWSALDFVLAIQMYFVGTLNWLMIGCVFGSLGVMYYALKYGKGGWSKIDIATIIVASIGIIYYVISPAAGMSIILLLMILGSKDTIKETLKNPKKESSTAWYFFFFGALLQTLLVKNWTLEEAGQPIVFLIIDSIMAAIIFFRPKKNR